MLVRLLGPVDWGGWRLSRGWCCRLTRGQVMSSDWLLEHLGPGGSPDSGLRAMRFHVSQLRKEIGDVASIETRPGGYRLDVPRDSVDAALFEDRARAARLESDDERAAVLCSDALALWRGEPFLDAAPCPTLDDEAVRLENLRLTVVEEAFERRLAAGSGGELIADLSQLVNEQPGAKRCGLR